jgi:hypothetical protein
VEGVEDKGTGLGGRGRGRGRGSGRDRGRGDGVPREVESLNIFAEDRNVICITISSLLSCSPNLLLSCSLALCFPAPCSPDFLLCNARRLTFLPKIGIGDYERDAMGAELARKG